MGMNSSIYYSHLVPFDQFLIVNNVPCEECEVCGEQYFKAMVLRKIEKDFMKINFSKKKTKRQIRVPVEEFVEI
jgi:hypothetical protein